MALYSYNPRCTGNDDYDIFDLADALARPVYDLRGLRDLRNANNLSQQLAALKESEVQNTDQEFRVKLRLGGFEPKDVTISTDNKRLVIKAKHEEREDKHGLVTREMTRIYTWPPGVDPKDVASTMTKEGVLLVTAKKKPEAPKEVSIPVEYKG